MYSWYATKYYYRSGDPLCDACDRAITRLSENGTLGHIAGFTRMDLRDDPPIDKGCEFKNVPAFVYHGQLVYEAKGDETEEDFERIVKLIMTMSDPKVQGTR